MSMGERVRQRHTYPRDGSLLHVLSDVARQRPTRLWWLFFKRRQNYTLHLELKCSLGQAIGLCEYICLRVWLFCDRGPIIVFLLACVSIHPSCFITAYPVQGHGETGASPRMHRAGALGKVLDRIPGLCRVHTLTCHRTLWITVTNSPRLHIYGPWEEIRVCWLCVCF